MRAHVAALDRSCASWDDRSRLTSRRERALLRRLGGDPTASLTLGADQHVGATPAPGRDEA